MLNFVGFTELKTGLDYWGVAMVAALGWLLTVRFRAELDTPRLVNQRRDMTQDQAMHMSCPRHFADPFWHNR